MKIKIKAPKIKIKGKVKLPKVKVVPKPILKAAGTVTGSVAGLSQKASNTFKKVPIVGSPIATVYSMTAGNKIKFVHDIAKGERVDKAAYNRLKRQVKDVQDIAPYAQTVVSFTPGVGPGVSGAIGAANALSKGQPISKAVLEGVKDSLPGGPLARAALEVSYSLASGEKPGRAVLEAIPLPPNEKNLVIQGIGAVGDLAKGKKLNTTLVDRGIAALPDPEMRKAAQIGIALAEGKALQDIAIKEAPFIMGALGKEGETIAKTNPFFKAGMDSLKGKTSSQKGYAKGLGLMSHKLTPAALQAAMSAVPPEERSGFEIAIGASVGASKVGKANPNNAVAFGIALARGLKGDTSRAKNPRRVAAEKSIAAARTVAVQSAAKSGRKVAPVSSVKTSTRSDDLLKEVAMGNPEVSKGIQIGMKDSTWWQRFVKLISGELITQ